MTERSGLLTIGPIVSYLSGLGYSEFRKEGILVEGWPVQFLSVANDLDAEALASSQEVTVRLKDGDVRTRMLKPEHIVATALRTGRPKDRVRVTEFLESDVVDRDVLCSLLERHGLTEALGALCRASGLANPCVVVSTR